MDNIKVGKFISRLRKSKNLTQKELANKLCLTDKTISKWERGQGYPDITSLVPLADILGVSTSEILKGEKDIPPVDEVMYIEKRKFDISKFLFILMTLSFIIAALVCVICDLAINKTISWSSIPITSLVFSWLLLMPLICYKERRIRASLLSLTLFILPFLFLLEQFTSSLNVLTSNISQWFFPLALPVTLISLACIWILYHLYSKTKINKWYISGFAILLSPILNYIINLLVDLFTNETSRNSILIDVICCVTVGLLLILLGFIRKR